MKIYKNIIRLIRKISEVFARESGEEYDNLLFINSSQVLPEPLSREEEEYYCRLKAQGSQEANNKLIVHNLRLVVYIAKKFEKSGVSIDDLISIGTIGLIKAVKTFCPAKNIKLATYASRCIENEVLMYLRKIGHRKNEISIDEPLNIDWDGNELLLSDILSTDEDVVSVEIENDDVVRVLMEAVNSLPERERRIICLRFGLQTDREYTQKEVADMLGISQSYISRIEKKILRELKTEMEKQHIYG